MSPRTIRPSSSYTFTINFKAPQNCSSRDARVRASIIYWYSNKVNGAKVMVSRNVSVQSEVQLQLFAEIKFNEESFNHSSSLVVNRKVTSMFILTDKKIYKPGQLVRYRVLMLNDNLKPYRKPFNLSIEDPRSNLIVQRTNVHLTKGVFSGQLQLSKVTPLGFWTINVQTKSLGHYAPLTIELSRRYCRLIILNSFSSTSKIRGRGGASKRYQVPANVDDETDNSTKNQNSLKIAVTAKYTHGKPVQGVVLMVLKLKLPGMENVPTIYKFLQLTDGKADVSVSYKDLLNLFPCSDSFNHLLYQTIEVEAFISEQVSGKVLKASSSVACTYQQYDLQFYRTSTSYKPGFSFNAFVKLTNPDLPQPLINDIQYTNGTYKNISVRALFLLRNYSSSFEKVLNAQFDKYGKVSLLLFGDENIRSFTLNAMYKDEMLDLYMFATLYASDFNNRDRQFLKLSTKSVDDVLQPGRNTTFLVRSTEPIKSFFYQFTITLSKQLALELAPRVKILTYYVSTKDEVVADAMTVNVEDYLVNKVNITFDKNATSPSQRIILNVEAEKDSVVFLTAVDKSVLLQQTPIKLTKMVSANLDKYESASSYWYDYHSDIEYGLSSHFKGTEELFDSLNLIAFSSSLIYKHVYSYEESYGDKQQAPSTLTTQMAPTFENISQKPGFGLIS
ncbi:hypothetical protein HELRODRAFT_172886 [Helobdella robusta]|uniref:Alpha-2-macroglobulin bait region domain-containing protein n=1 Tax=Helobdella robusta TaxID=6412 RepID=T1F626_HELRO|nr:hypothetical protein HELRODRAFT_172886 [Helobdella robusta]ESO03862.1 hypothetical protein HELRODRAFT_172886 [Helobdella robusta]